MKKITTIFFHLSILFGFSPLMSQTEALELEGAIKVGAASMAEEGTLEYNQGQFWGRTVSGWNILGNLWQTNGSGVHFNSGKVGVGTTSPDRQLTVITTDQVGFQMNSQHSTWADLWVNAGKAEATPRVVYAREGLFRGAHGINGDGNWQLSLFDPSTFSAKTRLHIDKNGKVGIGTSSPNTQLTVEADEFTGLTVTTNHPSLAALDLNANGANGVPAFRYLKNGFLFGYHGLTNQIDWILEMYDPDQEQFYTRLFVDNNGLVGIGTSVPNMRLHVEGDGILVSDGQGDEMILSPYLIESNIGPLIFNVNNSNNMLLVAGGGSVAIGTNTYAHRLELNGDAAKPGGGSWSVASDRRLKTDVQPYSDGLTDLMKINPVIFRYNGKMDLPTDKEYVGIIAQEIKKIAPYMVEEKVYKTENLNTSNNAKPGQTTDTKEQKFLSFDGSALTFMLINAVQEQQAIIEKLEQRIELLEQQ